MLSFNQMCLVSKATIDGRAELAKFYIDYKQYALDLILIKKTFLALFALKPLDIDTRY